MNDSERMIYQLHARTRGFAYRIEQARQIAIRGFETMQAPFASMSFGKDSIVMVHLLLSIYPHLPIMYVNCGEWDEWPDTPRVKRKFLALTGCQLIELTGPSIMTAYARAGFFIQDEESTQASRKAQRDYSHSLGEILDRVGRWHGFDGSFIGIRKQESDNRQRLFAMRGELYYATTRQLWACYPLMHWSARDVWAYIVKYGLPYNELYDLDMRGREEARNGAMFGSRSARYGRFAFMRQMYPDWYNRFAAEFPEARAYV